MPTVVGGAVWGYLMKEKGSHRQLQTISAQHQNIKIEYIVSSDLNRTIETAEYIASALDLPIHTDTRLRECNNGDLAGILNSEALVKFQDFWNTLAMDEAYPNGESPAAFYLRIKEWFDDIIKSSCN